jgi:hypothetical protein
VSAAEKLTTDVPPRGPSVWETARIMAERGARVVPLWGVKPSGGCQCGKPGCDPKHAGKHPMSEGWQHAASADLAVIARWSRIYPLGNAGVVLGGAPRLVAIDIDGPEGEAAHQAMIARLGPPADVEPLTTITGKGRHLFFRVPEAFDLGRFGAGGFPIRDEHGKHGPGYTLKTGPAGQVVLPGSLHYSGRRYTCADITAPWPELSHAWCLDMAEGREGARSEHARPAAPPEADPEPPLDSAPRWTHVRGSVYRSRSGVEYDTRRGAILDRASAWAAKPSRAEGNRDNGLFTNAISLVKGFDLSPGEAEPLLWGIAGRCTPPFTDRKQVARKCREADRVPDLKPRGWMLTEEHPRPGPARAAAGPARPASTPSLEKVHHAPPEPLTARGPAPEPPPSGEHATGAPVALPVALP